MYKYIHNKPYKTRKILCREIVCIISLRNSKIPASYVYYYKYTYFIVVIIIIYYNISLKEVQYKNHSHSKVRISNGWIADSKKKKK